MTRVMTQKQYALLRSLSLNTAIVVLKKREGDSLIKRGWVTSKWDGEYHTWVRLAPDGLRALADACERYGRPEIGPKARTEHVVCSNCNSRRRTHSCSKCGSTSYHFEYDEHNVPAEAAT